MDGLVAAAGGGGFRRLDDSSCEVKRMWTHPDYRRRELAARVLSALEDAARRNGHRCLVLETGLRHPEAERLYVERGDEHIGLYGRHPQARAFSLDLAP